MMKYLLGDKLRWQVHCKDYGLRESLLIWRAVAWWFRGYFLAENKYFLSPTTALTSYTHMHKYNFFALAVIVKT